MTRKSPAPTGGAVLSHKTLGECSIIAARFSQSGEKIFLVNYGSRGNRRQKLLSAQPNYWSDPAERVTETWERLAPKLKLTPGTGRERNEHVDERESLSHAA